MIAFSCSFSSYPYKVKPKILNKTSGDDDDFYRLIKVTFSANHWGPVIVKDKFFFFLLLNLDYQNFYTDYLQHLPSKHKIATIMNRSKNLTGVLILPSSLYSKLEKKLLA